MLGLSVALGVIAGKCGSLRLVLVGPVGCLRGRWRSGPRKWRHAAVSRARVSKHRAPVGALRPQPAQGLSLHILVSKHRAPVGALRQQSSLTQAPDGVSKHRAPVGALRHDTDARCANFRTGQQAPRTCRCIKTAASPRRGQAQRRQQAPRTCRCIKTAPGGCARSVPPGQQAPRTCRCIKTPWGQCPHCNGGPSASTAHL